MESERISLRLSPSLMREARRLAATTGISLGEWVRRLIESETGIDADMRMGFAALLRKRRQEIARSGGLASAAK